MKHGCLVPLQWVSIFTSQEPWQLINSTTHVCAGTMSWLAKRRKSDLSLEASSCQFVFTLNTIQSSFIAFIAVFVELVATGLKFKSTSLRSVGNIWRMHQSIRDVPSNKSTTRFLTVANQVHAHRSSMQMNNCKMPSRPTDSRLAVCHCCYLNNLMETLHVIEKTLLFTKFGSGFVLRRLATFN